MSTPVELIVIVIVVGLMVVRRLIGEPADARRMLLIPAVLAVVGLTDVGQVTQSPLSVGSLIGTGLISVALGVLRGASIRVLDVDGIVFMRYTVTTVVLLVSNFAIKIGSGFLLGAIDPRAEHAVSTGLALTFGVGMLAEGLAVLSKALRTGGRVMWGHGGQQFGQRPGASDDGRRPRAGTDARWGGVRRRGMLGALLDDVRDLGMPRPDDDPEHPQREPFDR